MIQKLFSVVTAVLALNFLIVAGGVGYLVATKKLDRAKAHAIRDIITTQPSTQPASATTQPATQPSLLDAQLLPLDALLAKAAKKPVVEQADFVRGELDAQAAIVERRLREIADQRDQLAVAKIELEKQRIAQQQQQKQLDDAKAEQARLAADEGFQKTLELYTAMPARRIKALFTNMDDVTVVRYLQAMDKDLAAGILAEFKTPQETSRAQLLMERMRLTQAKAD